MRGNCSSTGDWCSASDGERSTGSDERRSGDSECSSHCDNVEPERRVMKMVVMVESIDDGDEMIKGVQKFRARRSGRDGQASSLNRGWRFKMIEAAMARIGKENWSARIHDFYSVEN